jgi:hypothetical protein
VLEHLDRLSERQRLIFEAVEARRNNDDAKASQLLEKIIARYPDAAREYLLLAGIYEFGEADAPMAHRTRHRAKIAGDRPGRQTLRRHQHDPRPEHMPLLARRCPKPSLELRTLVRPKPDLSRIRKHTS